MTIFSLIILLFHTPNFITQLTRLLMLTSIFVLLNLLEKKNQKQTIFAIKLNCVFVLCGASDGAMVWCENEFIGQVMLLIGLI